MHMEAMLEYINGRLHVALSSSHSYSLVREVQRNSTLYSGMDTG